jgi:hypothetical protein
MLPHSGFKSGDSLPMRSIVDRKSLNLFRLLIFRSQFYGGFPPPAPP